MATREKTRQPHRTAGKKNGRPATAVKEKTRPTHKAASQGKHATRHPATAKTRPAQSANSNNANAQEARFLAKNEKLLSRTTLRARWIHSPDEHEDRPGQSLATRDHEVIRHWAEERGAEPATTSGRKEGERPRVLRFSFADRGRSRLQPISWDEWFETFDRRKLVFLFQEHLKNGNESNFFRFDSPKREEA